MLKRVWVAARCARLAVLAESMAAAERAPEAMKVLQKIYGLQAAGMPSKAAPVELNILLCQVSIATWDSRLALEGAMAALEQLVAGRGNYSPVDRRYLVAFATAQANYCLRWRDGDDAQELQNPVEDIRLDDVSRRIRARFILPPDGSYLDAVAPHTADTVH